VQTGAVDAVFVDLLWEALSDRFHEAEAGEEPRGAGEEADAGDLMAVGLGEQGLDELASTAGVLVTVVDGDGANLGEVGAVEVEGATADDLAIAVFASAFKDDEITDVFTDLGQAAGEECSASGIFGN
jgi:hypothetical protein